MAENTSSESTKAPTESVSSGASTSPFGDDDLGRIQGILIGDHARKTEERLNVMEVALLGAISDLRDSTNAQIESLETRLAAEAETHERAVSNLGSRMDREAADQAAKVAELRSDVESVEDTLKSSIDGTESAMVKAIDDAKLETKKDLETARAQLGADKVDRVALSKMLRALGDQLDEG